MAFTYDLATEIGQVRFKIGDVASSGAVLTDEEITYALAQCTSILQAAIMCVRSVLARYHPITDGGAGGLSLPRSQKSQQLRDVLRDLLTESGESSASPVFTGVSVSEREAIENDTDFIPTDFGESRDDNKRVGPI